MLISSQAQIAAILGICIDSLFPKLVMLRNILTNADLRAWESGLYAVYVPDLFIDGQVKVPAFFDAVREKINHAAQPFGDPMINAQKLDQNLFRHND